MSDLQKLRDEILALDDNIIASIAKRHKVSKQIGEYKSLHDLPIYDPKREELLHSYHQQLSERHNLPFDFIQKVFEIIMEQSKRTQRHE